MTQNKLIEDIHIVTDLLQGYGGDHDQGEFDALKSVIAAAESTLSKPDVAEMMAVELRAAKIRIEILGNILGKYYIEQNNQFHLPDINKALAAYEQMKSETENE